MNLYIYAVGNPLRFLDPLGLASFVGFPSNLETEARQALALVRQKLLEVPCCVAPEDGKVTDLLTYLDHPDFEIKYEPGLSLCGKTPFRNMIDANRRILVGPLAWKADCCYPGKAGINGLASSILHEIVHATYNTFSHALETEKRCFGCGPGGQ